MLAVWMVKERTRLIPCFPLMYKLLAGILNAKIYLAENSIYSLRRSDVEIVYVLLKTTSDWQGDNYDLQEAHDNLFQDLNRLSQVLWNCTVFMDPNMHGYCLCCKEHCNNYTDNLTSWRQYKYLEEEDLVKQKSSSWFFRKKLVINMLPLSLILNRTKSCYKLTRDSNRT